MLKNLKANWQFIAIIVPVLLVLGHQLRNYGAVTEKVKTTETKLECHIAENKLTDKDFTTQIQQLTIAVTRSNTLMEIYLMKKGIIQTRDDIDKFTPRNR